MDLVNAYRSLAGLYWRIVTELGSSWELKWRHMGDQQFRVCVEGVEMVLVAQ